MGKKDGMSCARSAMRRLCSMHGCAVCGPGILGIMVERAHWPESNISSTVTPPRISVVIPAHNEENELPGCLDRLGQQTFGGFEVIVVDNGSTDRTGDVAAARGARVIREPRLGAAYARQAGFSAAAASLVASTDADARVPIDWVERMVEAFDRSDDVVAVFGPFRFRRGTATSRSTERLLPLLSGLQRFASAATNAVGFPFFAGSNFAVRKGAFERVGGFFDARTDAAYSTWEDVQLGRKLRHIGGIVYRQSIIVDVSARYMGSLYRKFFESARKAVRLRTGRMAL